jgi:hypothetical protein
MNADKFLFLKLLSSATLVVPPDLFTGRFGRGALGFHEFSEVVFEAADEPE